MHYMRRTSSFQPTDQGVNMTRDQFIQYAHDYLDDLEPIYDQLAEYNSEVRMFGDAGPGAGYRLRQQIARIYKIERQLARLENREPRDFHLALRAAR